MSHPTQQPGIYEFTDSFPERPDQIMVAWTEPMMKWEVWFHYVLEEGDCCYHCSSPPQEIGVDVRMEPAGDGCWRIFGISLEDANPYWNNRDIGLLRGVPVPAPWLSTPVQSEDAVPNGP